MSRHPLQHDAKRDTMWVGKGVGWLVIAAIVAAAALAVLALG